MNAKIVYVLVSDKSDYYLEQTILSIISLKKKNPKAHITLLTDRYSNSSFNKERNQINTLIDEKIIIDVPEDMNKMQRSRFIKTSIRLNILGDFLFIDGDTVILKALDDIDRIQSDFSAVPDKHVTIINHAWNHSIQKNINKIGGKTLNPNEYYINSGVMYVRDTDLTKKLFKQWNENWIKSKKKGINSDQPSLAKTLCELNIPINILDGIWNCQITENGLRWYNDAKILHYFASMSKDFKNNEILPLQNNLFFQNIKDCIISYEDALTKISCPFLTNITLIGKYESEFRVTPFYKICYMTYHFNKKLSTIIDFISKIFLKIV